MYTDIVSDCKKAFPDAVLPDCEEFYRSIIAQCGDIYRGEPPWAYVKKSGLYGKGERRMNMLGCAKVLCDSMAALTFAEQADIICADSEQTELVTRVFQDNCFWENMPAFLSRAYALGGGVLKVYIDNGKICLDYVDADCFIPLGNNSGGICEGIFGSRYCRGGRYYTLLEMHTFDKGYVCVDRVLFSSKNGTLGQPAQLDELFSGLDEHSEYPQLTEPVFAYFRPAAANNIAPCTLLGLSCFANCIDTLKAADIAFDSLSREFILGRKRIIVPSSCIRTVVDPDSGNVSRYFDADDEVYQALKCDEERDLKITDNTASLRVTEHKEAISTILDLLCFQTGLSSGTLAFADAQGVRTAAEIKSRDTRTEMTMKQNRDLAAELIERTAKAVIRCAMLTGELAQGDISVKVRFSDKQVTDRSELIDENVKLVNAGLISKVTAVMTILDCDEKTALAELEKVFAEKEKEEKAWTA